MFAWKRIMTGMGVTGIVGIMPSCQNIHGEVQTPFIRASLDVEFFPMSVPENIDLDALKPLEFMFDGVEHLYYPSFGGVRNPETGRMYQLDDKTWGEFERLFRESRDGGLSEPRSSVVVNLKASGSLVSKWESLLDPFSSELSIVLNGSGDMVLPFWDVDRWPTLERALYISPDGVRGSADPMTIEVSGEACDVFGYLADFGLLEIESRIDGSNWSAIVDESASVVDIFVDETFVTSFSLPQ
ncbi:hypothetical protein H8D29_02850 [PVC group bacterium]|nr:hypothetical protein [PVC group bacterium]